MPRKQPIRITKKVIDNLAFNNAGQDFYWDIELKGFGVRVGQGCKTFIIQKDISGKSRRTNIGKYGTWTVEEAKKEARECLLLMDKGIDIVAKKREEQAQKITFMEAWAVHKEIMERKNSSPRTIESYEALMDAYLEKIKNRNLGGITRAEVRELHSKIGKDHGLYVANNSMRCFRAVYNTAMKENEYLPPNPTVAVQWFKQYRKQEPIPVDNLADWYEKVKTIPNQVRMDYQLFVLFTGLRRTDTSTITWTDVNFNECSLHRPNPKGGKERAFTIPLPDICMEILKRRKAGNEIIFGKNCPWVFPTYDVSREVTFIKEPKENKRGLPSPHRLRDTYTTAANSAGLSPYDIEVLTNHRPAKSTVTAGYIKQDLKHLSIQQQKVADYLKERINKMFQ